MAHALHPRRRSDTNADQWSEKMALEDIALAFFAACNALRIFAYLPQIQKVATDQSGATAISCTTWLLFLVAHLSTVAYALVIQVDWSLAACFSVNAACCVVILALTYRKRRAHARDRRLANDETLPTRSALPC